MTWNELTRQVPRLLHAHGLTDEAQEVRVELLGRGESHVNYRVLRPGGEAITVRVAIRAETWGQLRHQWDVLRALPAGFAQRGVVLDETRRLIPYPFAVLTYVEGRHPASWREALPVLRTLARLHAATEQPGHYDIRVRFESSLAYWRENHPDVLREPQVPGLLARLEQLVRERAGLFRDLRTVSRVHGDPVASNVLVCGDEARLIDWEWSEIGDPALDVSQIAWDIPNEPWQVQLPAEREAEFFAAYLAERPDGTLRERRFVWMCLQKFFDHLYLRSLAAQGDAARLAGASRIAASLEVTLPA